MTEREGSGGAVRDSFRGRDYTHQSM